jgi:hypothetical protein
LYEAELFRQRPNFLVDLAEKFGQELATLFLRRGVYQPAAKLLSKNI